MYQCRTMRDEVKKLRQDSFQSRESETKMKLQNFPKISSKEPCKVSIYQVSMQSED